MKRETVITCVEPNRRAKTVRLYFLGLLVFNTESLFLSTQKPQKHLVRPDQKIHCNQIYSLYQLQIFV